MMINFISKSLEIIELLISEKLAGVIFVWTKWVEKWQRCSNTKNAFRCQILVSRDYRFQFNIKILSERFMMINFISKSSEFVQILICEKIAGVIFVWTKWDEKSQRYSNTKNSFRCQILVLCDYRFQYNMKILSEAVMITNFISKFSEFIELLICEKIAGVIFVWTKWEENGKGTLTPKMPFAARFSCCATIDFNSILKYFPGGLS